MKVVLLLALTVVLLAGASARQVLIDTADYNWFEARGYCYRKYKHMAGSNRINFLTPRGSGVTRPNYSWYGGHHFPGLNGNMTSGWRWEHTNETLRYFNWMAGYPKTSGNDRYCMALTLYGQMVNLPCELRMPFYCENKY